MRCRDQIIVLRRLTTICLLVGLLLAVAILPACSAVQMDSESSKLLDQTAAQSADDAARAERGEFTVEECAHRMREQATAWQLFRNLRDGVDPTKTTATQP